MEMTTLWQQRARKEVQQLLRYARYIANDHAMLVGVFLLGFLLLQYAQFIKQLSEQVVPLYWYYGVSTALGLWSLMPRQLVTHVKPADQVFLTPVGTGWRPYLQRSLIMSMIAPVISHLVVLLVLGPLLLVLWRTFSLVDFVLLWAACAATSAYQLSARCRQCYLPTSNPVTTRSVRGALALLLAVYPLAPLVISVLVIVASSIAIVCLPQGTVLNWQILLQMEQQRVLSLQRRLQFFVDVPSSARQRIHRRARFSPVQSWLAGRQDNPFALLFSRVIIRGEEFGTLTVRLIVIGVVLMLVFQQVLVSGAIAVLFLVLLAYQLVPLVKQFDEVVLIYIYPVQRTAKRDAAVQLTRKLLVVTSACFAIGLLCVEQSALALLGGAVLLVMSSVILPWYIARQMGKYQS